ncbi:MAG: heme-binding beta-barrel domain-containing protein [Turneriella sp.]|nr:heme-binding beta-barrel domain-containing protein [Turneriella sp.]
MEQLMHAEDFFGPLAVLIGTWHGEQGLDVAPEPEGEARSPYFETITIEPVGDATNAEEQTLAVLAYKQVVSRKSDNSVFHHQIGYWYFDRNTKEIYYSLLIPRAVAVLARGRATAENGKWHFSVIADAADKNYGILESAFMAAKASTKRFAMELEVQGTTLHYRMQTDVHIYGRSFAHTDENTLKKIS